MIQSVKKSPIQTTQAIGFLLPFGFAFFFNSRDQGKGESNIGEATSNVWGSKGQLEPPGWTFFKATLPEQFAPENRPSQEETSIPTMHFGCYVSFREGRFKIPQMFASFLNPEVSFSKAHRFMVCYVSCRQTANKERT